MGSYYLKTVQIILFFNNFDLTIFAYMIKDKIVLSYNALN